MQKGFVTLEMILGMLIIVLLMTVAIPNANRVADKIALDYETKKLYTDLRFLQSFDRMTNMRDIYFYLADDQSVRLVVYPNRYVFEKNSLSFIYSQHYFSNGVKADKTKIVNFNDMGKIIPATSDTLNLTSRRGKKISIAFDTVGRFRCKRGE